MGHVLVLSAVFIASLQSFNKKTNKLYTLVGLFLTLVLTWFINIQTCTNNILLWGLNDSQTLSIHKISHPVEALVKGKTRER